jgi:dienelactone hydrolase
MLSLPSSTTMTATPRAARAGSHGALLRTVWTVAAVASLLWATGATPTRAQTPTPPGRFIATELPDSAVGRQLGWLLEASQRLPLSEDELRAHIAPEFFAVPGASPAAINSTLASVVGEGGLHLVGVTVSEPDAIVAVVTGRDARELVVTMRVGREGAIENASIQFGMSGRAVALPRATGPAAVGTDVVQLLDRTRGGRRLVLTRWYPAAEGAAARPLAAYASPRLTTTLAIPPVRVHARLDARARRARLPVVLFSPGFGTPRVLYQALAEDLASHGYLVVAVDHTGEAPIEFPDGRIELPGAFGANPIATASAIRLADLRFILRRLDAMGPGPRADHDRIAAVGHSLGGSTAAALMRVEPSVRAGVDMDGSIFGAARRRGVPRAFLVMVSRRTDPTIRSMLTHSRGPRLALAFTGFEHLSFSDLPAIAPAAVRARTPPTLRDIAVQRAYLRAFLDRSVRGRPGRLLDGPSRRWPQVRFLYRRGEPVARDGRQSVAAPGGVSSAGRRSARVRPPSRSHGADGR